MALLRIFLIVIMEIIAFKKASLALRSRHLITAKLSLLTAMRKQLVYST
jgi:hypothetical protein